MAGNTGSRENNAAQQIGFQTLLAGAKADLVQIIQKMSEVKSAITDAEGAAQNERTLKMNSITNKNTSLEAENAKLKEDLEETKTCNSKLKEELVKTKKQLQLMTNKFNVAKEMKSRLERKQAECERECAPFIEDFNTSMEDGDEVALRTTDQ